VPEKLTELAKPRRGFASMSPQRHREICAMGGRAVPPEKRGYFLNRELASRAGKLGGAAVPPEKRTFARDRQLAAECGRLGGQSVPAERRSFSVNPELASSAGYLGGRTPVGKGKAHGGE
jgi:uncharacterized protein